MNAKCVKNSAGNINLHKSSADIMCLMPIHLGLIVKSKSHYFYFVPNMLGTRFATRIWAEKVWNLSPKLKLFLLNVYHTPSWFWTGKKSAICPKRCQKSGRKWF